MKHFISLLVLCVLCVLGTTFVRAQTLPATQRFSDPAPANPALPTVWIIGDSTVHNATPPLVGWGDVIGDYFDLSKLNVVNRAYPGRSSRTFITEGRWQAVVESLKPGDFVLMQFGHNDESVVNEPPDFKGGLRSRGTLPGIGDETEAIVNSITHQSETVHTFGWYLRQYVSDTKSKGATAIICSYVPRLPKAFTPTTQPMAHGLWARQIAESESIPFINLRAILWTYHAQTAVEQTRAAYFPNDGTHTNTAGAKLNAVAVIVGLRSLPDNPLARYLRSDAPSQLPPPLPASP